jgi:hypothetical protein
MNDNNDEEILRSRMQEQLEAAAAHNQYVYDASRQVLDDMPDFKSVDKPKTKKELLTGYLLKEWTWLNTLVTSFEAGEDGVVPAPDHCEHVDPVNPTIWIARLATPNRLVCMECALEASKEDVGTGLELCDRCHKTNLTGEFFEFNMPVVNIQVLGTICKDCFDKV